MGSSVLWRDQLARMFQILLTLLSDRHPNARELSEQCEVSRRTIYRDLQSLILAGVPIEFRPELHGYQIAPSFLDERSRLDLRLVRSLAALPSYHVLIRVPTPLLSDLHARFPRPLTPASPGDCFPRASGDHAGGETIDSGTAAPKIPPLPPRTSVSFASSLDEPDDHTEWTQLEYTSDGLEQAVFELLTFADLVEVLEPPELRARLRDLATRIVRRQAANPPLDRTISKAGAVAG